MKGIDDKHSGQLPLDGMFRPAREPFAGRYCER